MSRSQALQEASRRGGKIAGEILKEKKEVEKWGKLLDSADENVVLKALIYLSNRAYGMPAQSNEISGPNGGPVQIAWVNDTIPRPERK